MAQIRYGSIALLFSGMIFLFFRFFAALESAYLFPAVLLPAVFSSAAAVLFAVRKCPAVPALRTALAALVPEGGLVLSHFETGSKAFAPLPELPPLPSVHYLTGRRDLLLLAASALFATGSLLVPVKKAVPPVSPAVLDIRDEKEKLSRELTVLEQLSPRAAGKSLALQKELEEVVQHADPSAPGRTYELLQELNSRIRQELTRESSQSTRQLAQMTALRQLIDTLSKDKKNKNAASFTHLLNELVKKNPALAESLKKGGFNGQQLSAEELKKLASALKTEADQLKKSLDNMGYYKETASSGKNTADPAAARQELEEFLKNNVPGSDDLIEALTNRSDTECSGDGMPGASGEEGGGGQGGPSRGGGSAALEFSNVPVDMDVRMIDRKAAPSTPGALRDSTVLGRFASDRAPETEIHAPQAGALQNNSARTTYQESTIHPAHRRAVKRYFERKTP